MTQWIDTHVHLFTEETKGETPVMIDGTINSTEHYLKSFSATPPAGVVVVDFSKAKQSDHVVATVEELTEQGVPAAGIIRGNIDDERTFDWIKRSDIAGIRLYGKGSIPDFSENKEKWDQLFTLVRQHNKHICLFGDPSWIRKLVAQLPDDLTLLVDHIGMPDAALGENQADFAQLLADLESRNKSAGAVYFKGPGYRTSFEANKTVPYLLQIIEKFGEQALLLGASDAPFAGPVVETGAKYEGKKNQEFVGYDSVLDYLNGLVEAVAQEGQKSAEMLKMQLLYSNAEKLYSFKNSHEKAA